MNPRLRAIVCFAERSAYRAGGQSSALPQEWTRIAKQPASPPRSRSCSLASLALYLRPSRARLTRSAWDARVASRRLLAKARAADKPTDPEALLVLAVACEALRSNLLKIRLFVREERDVLRS